MLTFYITAALISLGAAALIVRPLVTGRASATDRDTMDAEIFRDQLDEIDRDLARGTIQAEEAEGARIEISRRLLTATQRAKESGALMPAPRGPSGMIAGMLLMGVPALGALLYVAVGVPGAQDQPFASRDLSSQSRVASEQRPNQTEAEAQITPEMRQAVEQDPEYVELVAQVKTQLEDRPDDRRGQRLLASGLMRLGKWVEARKAYQRLIEISTPPIGADIHANLAEAMVLAAGGYVSPEAEQAIGKALKADPTSPMARYYAGLSLRQNGQIDQAIEVWEDLRQSSPADAPYLEWLNMMLAETVQMRGGGGVAARPGPTQEDIEAADEMSAEDRSAMIQGMVDRLAARLAERGGTAQEWAQLIASHSTLGNDAGAEQALIDALAAYPEGADHEALIAHANRLGIGGIELPVVTAPSETTAPGPTAEDIAAAQQMSASDRASMIEGMVARLEGRLLDEGGLAEDWLRLINAYVQLDRKDDAARIYKLADVALENDPSRGFVREQSLLLGVVRE